MPTDTVAGKPPIEGVCAFPLPRTRPWEQGWSYPETISMNCTLLTSMMDLLTFSTVALSHTQA